MFIVAGSLCCEWGFYMWYQHVSRLVLFYVPVLRILFFLLSEFIFINMICLCSELSYIVCFLFLMFDNFKYFMVFFWAYFFFM